MKFLCDRCKTRYSIADDRVRGKILKIRCKNCANVITVREGMNDDAGEEAAARRHRPTTGAPMAMIGAAGNGAATSPPAALEDEWYCSIEGKQSGPLSLPEAQRWVATKPFDAELHCWCEGFDDWLPVDKVSHFRNLRKRPPAPAMPPATPPPMPRGREDDPKPLFASTMAALERSAAADTSAAVAARAAVPAAIAKVTPVTPVAPTSSRPNGPLSQTAKGTSPNVPLGDPQPDAKSATAKASIGAKASTSAVAKATSPVTQPVTQPSTGPVAKTNTGPVAKANASPVPQPNTGPVAKATTGPMAKLGAIPLAKLGSGPNVTTPGMGAMRSLAASKPVDLFDAAQDDGRDGVDGSDSATAVGAPPILDEPPVSGVPARRTMVENDDLEIGEVSRVVNLADLAAAHALKKTATPRAGLRTSPIAKLTPGELRVQSPLPGALLAGDSAAATVPLGVGVGPSESMIAQAPALAQRRGMFILIGAAAVLLVGGIAAVVLFVTQGDEGTGAGSLARAGEIDTSRPEDVIRRAAQQPIVVPSGSGTKQPHRWTGVAIHQPNVPDQPEVPTDPTKAKLRIDEIEDMARKQNDGTNRCYMRAQKGALGYEIQDLKKIAVTVTVAADGTVSDVTLSDHGDDQFGKCLIGRVKSWKFRESPGGLYRFELAFAQP